MVQLPDATNFNQSTYTVRRHADPPKLWFGVAAGSIAAHLLLLAIALPLVVRFSSSGSGSQAGTASVPVELVDLPADVSLDSSAPSTSTTASELVPNNQAPNSATTQPQPAPASQFSPPVLSPDTPAPPQDAVEPSNPPVSPAEDNLAEDDAENDVVEPSPVPPTLPSENQAPSGSNPVPPGDRPVDTPGESGDNTTVPNSSGEDTLAEAETSAPPGSLAGEDTAALPEIGVSGEATPSSFTATLSYSPLPEGQRGDIHDQLPVPKESVRPFTYDPSAPDISTCVVSPESLRDFGQVVSMQVVVESDGTVSDALVRDVDPRVSSAYQDLAQCLVKNWSFEPAADIDPATNQPVPVADDSLVVSIQINWQ